MASGSESGLIKACYAFYKNTKRQYPDPVVLMQIGDFHNAFDDDAQKCANELDWIMTPLIIAGEKVKCTGVPSSQVEHYVKLLIEKGLTVILLDRVL